jgi:hypothetical protein
LYRELATINKVIGLSPQSALDRAETFLAQQGYSILLRTDTSLTVKRDEPDYPIEEGVLALTVKALPQPEGGVRVKVRGNDEEGIRERQNEWREWVESLPDRGSDEPDTETTPLYETEDQFQIDDLEKSGPNVLVGEEESRQQAPAPQKKTQKKSEVQAPIHERTEEANSQKEASEVPEVSTEPRSAPCLYEYKMLQLPPTFATQEEDQEDNGAARYLQSIANEQAEQGWEFYRVDALSDKGRQRQYFVATFRRLR